MVAETPDECTNFHGVYTTREEAEEAANALCVEQDATPDLDDVMAEIKETGYFTDPDIIPLVVKAATQYSQGYLLVTPDIRSPLERPGPPTATSSATMRSMPPTAPKKRQRRPCLMPSKGKRMRINLR